MGETRKAHDRRVREGWFERWCNPRMAGLDIGCGDEPILPTFRRWDKVLGDGDAAALAGMPADAFATLYASHVLEHLQDPAAALRRWYEVTAPYGHLIVVVPHRDLYEGREHLPSRWNPDHKTYWLPDAAPPGSPPHTRGLLQTLRAALPAGATVLHVRVLDAGHSWPPGGGHPLGEYSIEAVVGKLRVP